MIPTCIFQQLVCFSVVIFSLDIAVRAFGRLQDPALAFRWFKRGLEIGPDVQVFNAMIMAFRRAKHIRGIIKLFF
jgi:hypothetical protein